VKKIVNSIASWFVWGDHSFAIPTGLYSLYLLIYYKQTVFWSTDKVILWAVFSLVFGLGIYVVAALVGEATGGIKGDTLVARFFDRKLCSSLVIGSFVVISMVAFNMALTFVLLIGVTGITLALPKLISRRR